MAKAHLLQTKEEVAGTASLAESMAWLYLCEVQGEKNTTEGSLPEATQPQSGKGSKELKKT